MSKPKLWGAKQGLALADMAPGGYTKVDAAGAREALFGFGYDDAVVPADMQALLPVEPSSETIDTARAAFRAALTDASMQFKPASSTSPKLWHQRHQRIFPYWLPRWTSSVLP